MNKTTKQLIEYCKKKERETPEVKNNYYSKKRKQLTRATLSRLGIV